MNGKHPATMSSIPWLLVFFCLGWPFGAFASSGTEGASFLDIPVGARPAALGSAYSALAQDAYAPIYNPAGMGFLPSTQIAAEHLSYLESINYEFISAVHPLVDGKAIGVAAQYLGTGDLNASGPQAEPLGTYSDHYAAYSLVYGQKITDKFALGLTGKWIQAKLADVSANAYAVDVGGLYQASTRLKLAATVANIGTKLTFLNQDDRLPLAGHLGIAYGMEKNWNLVLEGVYSQTGLFSGRSGIEWIPHDMLSLRAGYNTDTSKELSALSGLTVGVGLHVWRQEFAYAWLPHGDLGNAHYLSLLLKFGETERRKRNLIQYQAFNKRPHPHADGLGEDLDPDFQQLIQILDQGEERMAMK